MNNLISIDQFIVQICGFGTQFIYFPDSILFIQKLFKIWNSLIFKN